MKLNKQNKKRTKNNILNLSKITIIAFIFSMALFSLGCARTTTINSENAILSEPVSENTHETSDATTEIPNNEADPGEPEEIAGQQAEKIDEEQQDEDTPTESVGNAASTLTKQESEPTETADATQNKATITATQRIQPSDITYEGAFRLPGDRIINDVGWEWGGLGAAYNPDGDVGGAVDGYSGSLFLQGHNWYAAIGEISIPQPVNSKNLEDLNTAENLRDFVDVREELFGYLELIHSGIAYLPAKGDQTEGKLYFTFGPHLDEDIAGRNIGWIDSDLDMSSVAGPWGVNDLWSYFVTEYMFDVPEDFAEEYLNGNMLVAGRFRDGGQASEGPTMYAFAPWKEGNPPTEGANLHATTLLKYDNFDNDYDMERALDDYTDADSWSGGSWLTKDDKSAVIFAGYKGKGAWWYGYQDGTAWFRRDGSSDLVDEGIEGAEERGWWADRWEGTIIFYDPADLARVAAGEMEPWEPQPYATMNIDEYLFHPATHEIRELGSVAYDQENNKLYVVEFLGDTETERPIVHVFSVV